MEHRISFSTHSKEITDAYQNVRSPTCATNWALFGYSKNSNELCVVSTGTGGLNELQSEFEDSKVQYAFAKVLDSNTGLFKFVFISWVYSYLLTFVDACA